MITTTGDADGDLVFTRNGIEIRGEDARRMHGVVANSNDVTPPARSSMPRAASLGDGASRYREVERNTQAKTALTQLGYKSTTAARAVERARAHVPAHAALEVLLQAALRHCD